MSLLSRLGLVSSSRSRPGESSSTSGMDANSNLPVASACTKVFQQNSDKEEDIYNVQIPRGVAIGGSFWFYVNDTRRVKVWVPAGYSSGQWLRVVVPPPTPSVVPPPPAGFVDFTIPVGAREGCLFYVVIKGKRMCVRCPLGKKPGDTLRIADPTSPVLVLAEVADATT